MKLEYCLNSLVLKHSILYKKPKTMSTKTNTEKIEIVDVETTMALLGCTRANVYGYYLKKKILTPVPRVGKKSYFYYKEVSKILNEKLADIAARKNLRLSKKKIDNANLITQEFLDTYTELTHKE